MDAGDGPAPLAWSIDETARSIGISRAKLYDEIKAGHLRSIKIGRRRLIPVADAVAYINALPSEAA